ncbi:hypothetical protein ACWDBD_17270 [Streptomyces sp. NPDC001118]
MPRFSITAKVTGKDGSTRQVTGTVERQSPLYGHDKARVDAANQLAKTLKPGETFDPADIDVRYAR